MKFDPKNLTVSLEAGDKLNRFEFDKKWESKSWETGNSSQEFAVDSGEFYNCPEEGGDADNSCFVQVRGRIPEFSRYPFFIVTAQMVADLGNENEFPVF